METRIASPRLASQAPSVIKIRDLSPLKEMLLDRANIIINKFIVPASRLKRTLKRCLYCKERANKAIIKPNIPVNVK